MTLPTAGTDKQGRGFLLRAYEPADRRELERMYESFEPKRAAQGLPAADAGRRRRWLDAVLAAGYHVIVEIDGRMVGHGMLLPFGRDDAELANFLHQSVRDRGIGTALNLALLDVGREHGLRRVWLSVEPSNRSAVRSYERAGFRRRFTSGWAPELEMEIFLSLDEAP